MTLDGTGQSVALMQFDGYYPSDIQSYEQTFGLSTNIPVLYELLSGIKSISTGASDGEAALDIEMASFRWRPTSTQSSLISATVLTTF